MQPTAADAAAAQAQLLESIRTSQQLVVEAVQAWTDAAARATPAVALPEPPADQPNPSQVVASSFDFAEKLLATQREFAEKLVGIVPQPAVAEH
jgi:hypothetical protein